MKGSSPPKRERQQHSLAKIKLGRLLEILRQNIFLQDNQRKTYLSGFILPNIPDHQFLVICNRAKNGRVMKVPGDILDDASYL